MFIALLFFIPLALQFGLKISAVTIKIISAGFLGFWSIVKMYYSKLNIKHLNIFDLCLLGTTIYISCHFCFFSSASIFYYRFWMYLSFIHMFYMLMWSTDLKHKQDDYILYILNIIITVCVIESTVGILQYFDLLKLQHAYYKLQGSFYSPNFLAAFIGTGMISIAWLFLTEKIKNKMTKLVYLLVSIFFLVLVILSKSRGTWLAVSVSLLLLFGTSKSWKTHLSNISSKKAIVVLVTTLFLAVLAGKLLYNLKPDSVDGRVLAAKITLQEIRQHPIKGHGLFSFAGKYNIAKANYFSKPERSWSETKHATYIFSPFNIYLLIAFELGLPVLFILLILMVLAIIKTNYNMVSRLGLSLLIYMCVWSMFNSIQVSPFLVFIAVFGVVLLIKNTKLKSVVKLSKNLAMIFKFLTLAISCLCIYVCIIKLINTEKYNAITQVKNEDDANELIYLSKFVHDNSFTDAQLGVKLHKNGFHEKGTNFLEKAFNKSAAPRIGKWVAHYAIKTGNYKKAESVYKFNINVEPYRFEPIADLISLYKKTNNYNGIVNVSQKLIDLPVKIPSQQVIDYKNQALEDINRYSKGIDSSLNLKGSISKEQLIKSDLLNKTLPYKVYLPPINYMKNKLSVIYINDGYSYLKSKLPMLIDSLIVTHKIKPLAAVFLDPRDKNKEWKNIRQELFLCNPKFIDFFTKEFIPTVESKYPISIDRENRTALGVSFGGLASAYLGDKATDYFKNIAMQSPAFHPCPDIYTSYNTSPKKDLKLYLSYGTGKDTKEQDIPFVNILRQKGYDLKLNVVKNGNHDWSVWKEQLDDILIYFYGID